MVRTLLSSLRIEMLPVLGRLPAYSRITIALLREPELKLRHKAVLVGGLAYLVSPIDLIPGLVPVLGQIDDLAVALWTLRRALRAMPPGIAGRHLAACGVTWDQLDADLARVGRSGRLLVRAGVKVAERVAGRVGRALLRLGLRVLDRTRLVQRFTA